MKTHRAWRVVAAGVVLVLLTGCQAVRELVALPFEVAGHVAAETARLPYEAAKMSAQGVVDAIAHGLK